jgi:hypothetical protein
MHGCSKSEEKERASHIDKCKSGEGDGCVVESGKAVLELERRRGLI